MDHGRRLVEICSGTGGRHDRGSTAVIRTGHNDYRSNSDAKAVIRTVLTRVLGSILDATDQHSANHHERYHSTSDSKTIIWTILDSTAQSSGNRHNDYRSNSDAEALIWTVLTSVLGSILDATDQQNAMRGFRRLQRPWNDRRQRQTQWVQLYV